MNMNIEIFGILNLSLPLSLLPLHLSTICLALGWLPGGLAIMETVPSYSPSIWVRVCHALPRLDLTMQMRDNSFVPDSWEYQQVICLFPSFFLSFFLSFCFLLSFFLSFLLLSYFPPHIQALPLPPSDFVIPVLFLFRKYQHAQTLKRNFGIFSTWALFNIL